MVVKLWRCVWRVWAKARSEVGGGGAWGAGCRIGLGGGIQLLWLVLGGSWGGEGDRAQGLSRWMSGGRRRRTRRRSGWDLRLGGGGIFQRYRCGLIRVGKSVLRFEDLGNGRGCGDMIVLGVRIAGALILMVV